MLHELISSTFVKDRSKSAVIDTSGRITRGELHDAVMAFAARLQAAGARAGDRVAIPLPNGTEAAIAVLGTLQAGAVMVPLHAGLKGDALRLTLEDADPAWIVSASGGISARGVVSGEDSSGLAALLYTSGSTGNPKGVMLTPANMAEAIRMVNAYLRISPEDIIHTALPLSSSYGLYQLLLGLAAGATVLLDRGFAFPASCLAIAQREGATVMAAVPAMLGWMAQSPLLERYDLSSLRLITSAAAALPPAHSLALRRRMPRAQLCVMYGQTECKRISYLDPAELEAHTDAVGRGLSGQEHRVVDAEGNRVPPGEVGELIVRGPHVMRGYWRKPAETAQKLRHLDAGGPWLFTGDAFTEDDTGLLRFVGRNDEIMKIGGNKVSPVEIERVLCQMPGVLEAAVLGIPDEQWGQVAAAFIVMAEGSSLTAEELKRHCSQRLRGYMVPREFCFRKSLPKAPSGKILKQAIDPSRTAAGALPA